MTILSIAILVVLIVLLILIWVSPSPVSQRLINTVFIVLFSLILFKDKIT